MPSGKLSAKKGQGKWPFDMKYQAVGLASLVLLMAIIISMVLLFVGMALLVLIHVCIVGKTITRGSGPDNNSLPVAAEARGSRLRNVSMSRGDLEKLPCFEFNSAKEMKGLWRTTASSPPPTPAQNCSPVDCAVCLENFRAGQRCRLLPQCGHSFHVECVDMWLLRTPICPICRTTAQGNNRPGGEFITGEGGHSGTASPESLPVVTQTAAERTGSPTQTREEAIETGSRIQIASSS